MVGWGSEVRPAGIRVALPPNPRSTACVSGLSSRCNSGFSAVSFAVTMGVVYHLGRTRPRLSRTTRTGGGRAGNCKAAAISGLSGRNTVKQPAVVISLIHLPSSHKFVCKCQPVGTCAVRFSTAARLAVCPPVRPPAQVAARLCHLCPTPRA